MWSGKKERKVWMDAKKKTTLKYRRSASLNRILKDILNHLIFLKSQEILIPDELKDMSFLFSSNCFSKAERKINK